MVTSTIVFEGEGRLQEYVGGYDDWLRQRTAPDGPLPTAPKEPRPRKDKSPKEKQKLSFKETRELEALPQKLEALEKEKQRLIATLNSPAFYELRDAVEINKASARLADVEKELDEAYRRWDELETLTVKFGGEPG